MRLVCESAGQRNVREPLPRECHPETSSGEHVPNAVSDNDGGFDGRAEPSRRGNEQIEIGFLRGRHHPA